MGIAQQMSNLINLAKKIYRKQFSSFLLLDKVMKWNYLLKEMTNNSLKNITYLPPVNQKTYLEMLNEIDIGMFSLHFNHKTHNFPGKLLSYMFILKTNFRVC